MSQTTIYISQENLIHNYHTLVDLAHHEVWPVLKSNAYGHGIKEVVSCLQNTTPHYFIVQNYFEAQEIWKHTDQQILMLGTQEYELYDSMNFENITPVVSSLKLLEHLSSLSRPVSIHLKINTGMNRQGVDPKQLSTVISVLKNNQHITVTGVLTHFSDADGPENSFTTKQYECFKSCISVLQKNGISPEWIHCSNSAGLSKISNNLVNASRAGIGLYGLNPLEKNDNNYHIYSQLKPVLSFETTITHIRTIRPGEFVGYGNTYRAQQETTVATIPVGYYEGIPRIMSTVGICSTKNGFSLPIIGRVSMNLITLDVTSAELCVGDKVLIYSSNQNHSNTVRKNAKLCGTINYELTTNLKPHITRVVV